MEYQCVDSRFYFWDGKTGYTVEFSYDTWYVFEDRKNSDALFSKKVPAKKYKLPQKFLAEDILYEYLNK